MMEVRDWSLLVVKKESARELSVMRLDMSVVRDDVEEGGGEGEGEAVMMKTLEVRPRLSCEGSARKCVRVGYQEESKPAYPRSDKVKQPTHHEAECRGAPPQQRKEQVKSDDDDGGDEEKTPQEPRAPRGGKSECPEAGVGAKAEAGARRGTEGRATYPPARTRQATPQRHARPVPFPPRSQNTLPLQAAPSSALPVPSLGVSDTRAG